MNNETYVECLVKKEVSGGVKVIRVILTTLTAICAILGIIGFIVILAIALVLGVATYFYYMYSEIEYEYTYLDKEITIDKIMNRSKRKRVGVYEIERMEILAPINSYHLDDYKNRTIKPLDCSSRTVKQPDTRYVMFYDGTKKFIMEPSAEMVNAIRNVAPRKVFTD